MNLFFIAKRFSNLLLAHIMKTKLLKLFFWAFKSGYTLGQFEFIHKCSCITTYKYHILEHLSNRSFLY